jgi:hypothetical protein
VTLAGTGAAFFWLFTSRSLGSGLPAAVAVGMFGSMTLIVPQTTVQRVIPNALLGRVTAAFLAGEAAVTLAGATAGPFIAQAAGLTGVAAVASLVTLGAAALAVLIVPGVRYEPPRPSAAMTASACGPSAAASPENS